MLRDLGRSKEMGERASHLAQDYAWNRIADRVLDVLETVTRRTTQSV
jgi:hypothetical protein